MVTVIQETAETSSECASGTYIDVRREVRTTLITSAASGLLPDPETAARNCVFRMPIYNYKSTPCAPLTSGYVSRSCVRSGVGGTARLRIRLTVDGRRSTLHRYVEAACCSRSRHLGGIRKLATSTAAAN